MTGSEREHPLNPVLATKLSTSVYDESRTLHDKILNNDNLDIRITVKKNGTIWHRGLLDRVQNGDQVNRDNPRLDLTWTDGLTRLKSLSWNEEGRETLLRTLNHILTESTRIEIPVRIAIAWEDDDASVTGGRSQALLHDLTRQIGSGTYWDVLMQILRYYNCQCFQEDGRWYVLHRSYRDSGQSYDWEEMDATQSVTTGSTNPSVSLSNADWYEQSDDKVRRPTLTPDGWRSSISLDNVQWHNSDFSAGATDLDGKDVPEGWWLAGSGKHLTSSNQVEVIPTIDGVDKSGEPGFAERVLDKRVVNQEDGGPDQVSFQLSGELDSKNNVGDAEVILGEIRLRAEDGRERWVEVDVTKAGALTTTITTSRSYIKRTIDLSSTTGISWSIPEFSINAPNVVAGDDVWWLRARCVSEADPEGNGIDDITSVRWDNFELTDFQEATGRNVPGGVSHDMPVQDELQTEEFSSSSDLEGHPNGIYYESSQIGRRWEHLHSGSAGFNHVGRSYITEHAEEMRLRDRWSMMSQKLFRIVGTQDVSTAHLRSTITYKGKDWVPHHRVEWINKSKCKVGFTELRNDDDLNATIDRYTGVDRGGNVDQATGVGGSGTTGATTHSAGVNVEARSFGNNAGGDATIITINASNGNVTEQLPSAPDADNAIAIRVDTSSNMGTIEDPDGNTIYWSGRSNATSYDLYGRQALYFTSDGSNWYVENPAVYEAIGTVTGKPASDQLFFQHPLRDSYLVQDMRVRAEIGANDPYDLTVTIDGTSQTHTLSGGSSGGTQDTTFTIDLNGSDYIRVTGQSSRDDTLENVSIAFKANRY
jgi:hypothetical protein